MTLIIDGVSVKHNILANLKETVKSLDGQPGLAVILVGDNPASKAYIGMKKRPAKIWAFNRLSSCYLKPPLRLN